MGLTDFCFRRSKWNELLDKLKRGEICSAELGSAIVRLGKPFNKDNILAAKDVIATYLNHEDAWVRHEAMWFLTSWGRLPEYKSALTHALQNDPVPDNRAYAASCLGVLCKGGKNPEGIKALKSTVENQQEDELVRKYAYRSLLQITKTDEVTAFSPNDKQLSDIDWDWVSSLTV